MAFTNQFQNGVQVQPTSPIVNPVTVYTVQFIVPQAPLTSGGQSITCGVEVIADVFNSIQGFLQWNSSNNQWFIAPQVTINTVVLYGVNVAVSPGQVLTFHLNATSGSGTAWSYTYGFVEFPQTFFSQTLPLPLTIPALYIDASNVSPNDPSYRPNQQSMAFTLQNLTLADGTMYTGAPSVTTPFNWQGYTIYNGISTIPQGIQLNAGVFYASFTGSGYLLPAVQNLTFNVPSTGSISFDLDFALSLTNINILVESPPSFGNWSAVNPTNGKDHIILNYQPTNNFVGLDTLGYQLVNNLLSVNPTFSGSPTFLPSLEGFITFNSTAPASAPPPPPVVAPPPAPGTPPPTSPGAPPPTPAQPITVQITSFGSGQGNRGVLAGSSSQAIMAFPDIQAQLNDLPDTFTRTGDAYQQLVDAETAKLSYYTQTQGDLLEQTDFSQTTGGWLDVWGSILDIPRRPLPSVNSSESDVVYRNRLADMVASAHATPNAIIDWIKNVELLTTVEVAEIFPGVGYQIVLPFTTTNDQISNLIRTLAWVRPAGVPFVILLKSGGTFLDTTNYFNAPRVTGAYLAANAVPVNTVIPQSTNNQQPIFPDLFFSNPLLNPNTVAADTIPTVTTTVAPDNTVTAATNVLGYMAANGGLVTDYNVGSQMRTIVEATSSVVEIEGAAIDTITDATLPYSGMSLFGFYPQQAAPATGMATFSVLGPVQTPTGISFAVSIPVGTVVATVGGIAFTTTQAVILQIGSTEIDVPVVCNTVGILGNIPSQSLTQVLSTGLSFPLHVTNNAAFSTGRDNESVAATKAMLFNFLDSLDRATPVTIAQDVIGVTFQGEKVAFANCVEPWVYLNQTTVAAFTLYIDNGLGTASAGLITAAQNWLNGSVVNPIGNRPAGVPFSVAIVQPIFVNITITGQIDPTTNPNIVLIYINNAVVSYFNQLQFGQTAFEAELDASIANGTLGLLTSLTISLTTIATPGSALSSVACMWPYQRVVLQGSPNITINYEGFAAANITFAAPPPAPPLSPPPAPPVTPPPPPSPPPPASANLLISPSTFNVAPWVSSGVTFGVSPVNLDPFGSTSTILDVTWAGSTPGFLVTKPTLPTKINGYWWWAFAGGITVGSIQTNYPQCNYLSISGYASTTEDGNWTLQQSVQTPTSLASDIKTWTASGRICVILIGNGASGGEGNGNLTTPAHATQLVASLSTMVETYGIQGMDWDLESKTDPSNGAWNRTTVDSVISQMKAKYPGILNIMSPRYYEVTSTHPNVDPDKLAMAETGAYDLLTEQYYYDLGTLNGIIPSSLNNQISTGACPANKWVMGVDIGEGLPASVADAITAYNTAKGTNSAVRGAIDWTSKEANLGFTSALAAVL